MGNSLRRAAQRIISVVCLLAAVCAVVPAVFVDSRFWALTIGGFIVGAMFRWASTLEPSPAYLEVGDGDGAPTEAEWSNAIK